MKTYRRPSSGIALVIVLGFLVIISALAVAFFSSVTTELKASRNFASGITTRQLSESAVNVVMGQIRNATSVPYAAWASQPGVIRTFGSGIAASTEPLGIYKLYSSGNMVISASQLSTGFTEATNNPYKDVDVNWSGSPALWTDLNSPVAVADPANPSSTVQRFPVIDPRAYAQFVPNEFTDADANVEGFWYDSNTQVKGVVGPSSGPAQQRLPMPVRWIYVLQDGSLTTPDGGVGTEASWSGSQAIVPKKENPIVGRIAFWTDDDSSKVNLNTAGGFVDPSKDNTLASKGYTVQNYAGSFWDTPRFYSEFDRGMPYQESLQYPKAGTPLPGKGGLAICQLLQGEYQRYPGHPATTSLGLIFGGLLTSEQMYSILPRLGTTNSMGTNPGSSVGGTNRVVIGNTGSGANPTPDNLQLQPKSDRLFASVDELLFAAKSVGKQVNNPNFVRTTNDTVLKQSFGVAQAITPEAVEKLRFFLTAHSRAPELNLFGRPRISVWPVRFETNTEASGLNPFDNVILFCSTIGTPPTASNTRPLTITAPSATQTPLQLARINPATTNTAMPFRYIFTRRELPAANAANATNPTLPTEKATWSAPTDFVQDINQPRNKQLMVYLQNMTSALVPGFSKLSTDTFANKLGADNRDNLLVEIFDYIRCANAKDTTTKTIGQTTAIPFAKLGLVMPSKPTYMQGSKKFSGLGRMPTISEVTLVFYYAGPKLQLDPVSMTNKVVLDPATGFPTKRRLKAFLLFSTFNPMQGYAPTSDPGTGDPKISVKVSGLNKPNTFMVSAGTLGDTQLAFGDGSNNPLENIFYRSSGGTWGGRNFGGYEGFMHTLVGQNSASAPNKIMYQDPLTNAGNPILLPPPLNGIANQQAAPSAYYGNQEFYKLQSTANIEIDTAQQTFNFKGGDIEVEYLYGGFSLQKFQMTFPDGTNWPVPKGDPEGVNLNNIKTGTDIIGNDPTKWSTINGTANGADGTNFVKAMERYYWSSQSITGQYGAIYAAAAHGSETPPTPYLYQTRIDQAWSFGARLCWAMQPSYNALQNSAKQNQNWYGDRWRQIVQPGDTIRSLIFCHAPASNENPSAVSSGDMRMALIPGPNTGDAVVGYYPHPDYNTPKSRACNLRMADGNLYFPNVKLPNAKNYLAIYPANLEQEPTFGNHIALPGTNTRFPTNRAMGNLPYTVTSVTRLDTNPGDFDTGVGSFPDGAFLNKQDEGNVIYAYLDTNTQQYVYPIPYFGTWAYEAPGNTFTSPNRQMPSPGMIGSLPARPMDRTPSGESTRGWETLSFSPVPAGQNHPGNQGLKDHLLLDLFWMPVVEPYPISEPFSTAGKINMNYQILPFTYISRSTGMRAALHSVRVTAVGKDQFNYYKTGVSSTGDSTALYDQEKGQNRPVTEQYRFPVDRNETLKAFDDFFKKGETDPTQGIFKSATEICERYLYPLGGDVTFSSGEGPIQNWWYNSSSGKTLGGDNTREKPYVDLYPRLTTKSNTYTVHMRVQTLQQLPKAAGGNYAAWTEGKDRVLGEYRGSTTIERYIDPADARFDPTNSNFAKPDDISAPNLESIYRFRAVENKKFAP